MGRIIVLLHKTGYALGYDPNTYFRVHLTLCNLLIHAIGFSPNNTTTAINNALSFVGKISLEFYLIHEFILRLLMTVSNRVFYISPFLQKMCGFIISLNIAYMIHVVMTKLLSEKSKKGNGKYSEAK